MTNLLRKTKIICTIGPACSSEAMLREMMLAGMNVCRLNFSHGTHETHQVQIDLIKRLREELNLPVAILLDTKGPEIRIGKFPEPVQLAEGSLVEIVHDDVEGTAERFSCSYKHLARDLAKGSRILIDDGLVELIVEEIRAQTLYCRVKNGGVISSNKSINLPETAVGLPSLTEQDIKDLKFAVDNDLDFIAASFIRKASDVVDIRSYLHKFGGDDINIISKIENREGVDNFEEILRVSDGIMVARGDLGVEIPAHEVPSIQKHLIRSCYRAGKPCITATQMLDSMIRNPRPTRAEVSDVANAILDGTSSIMLSGETAAGKYPLEALTMMDKIACHTEQNFNYWEKFERNTTGVATSVANAVSHACCLTAKDLRAKAIIAVTHAGRTARLLSRFRPGCAIIATTVSSKARYQLGLSWGVIPYQIEELKNTDKMFEKAKQIALESGVVSNGDLVVISGGTPVGMSGTTNTLKVQSIGHILCRGNCVGTAGTITGETYVVGSVAEKGTGLRFDGGQYILVAHDTDNSLIPLMKKAAAVVVENTNPDCHAITVGKTLDIPVIYACENASKIIKNGAIVTIDGKNGTIS